MTASFNFKERFSKKHLLENLGLKIASILIAIALWFIVVIITDPIVTGTYRNVPIRIINSDVITSQGKTLEVVEGSEVIPVVTVKAPRTVIGELGTSIDNIVATADMNNLSADGTSVVIDLTTTKYSDKVDSIRGSLATMKVNIEPRKTIQLPLYATTSGEIESGYILGTVAPVQNQVRVSGPESVISTIKTASVDVQVTGFTGNISTEADIVLYDEEGNVIPRSNLDLNVNSVRVDAEILATKKVPIYFATSGVPADGYAVTGEFECNPEVVVIAGSNMAIDKVSEIKIPSSELNITGQSEDLLTVINVTDFLPDGVRLGDSSYNGKASIKIFIEPLVEQTFELPIKEISITGVPEEYEIELLHTDDEVSITMLGLAQDLEKIKISDLNPRVDFDDFALLVDDISEIQNGSYEFYLVMDLPEGVEVTKPIGVWGKLTNKED